jgi:hypothetical protein
MRLFLAASLVFAFLPAPVFAQAIQQHRHHPAADLPLHEKFYSTWYMPDNPKKSCCNKADCYPTEITYRDGEVFAKRREDGKWLRVPAVKIEARRDNPDGRNHLCAPPPNASYPPDTVFCFTLGSGT